MDMDDGYVEIDWTPSLGYFQPFHLIYFPNILHLDISDCNNITASDFIDCIQLVPKLDTIIMDGCDQFSQYHFVKIFTQIKMCSNVSLLRCQLLPFTPVYCILASLRLASFIDFEPGNVDSEEKDWRKLIAIFFKVRFGPNFTSKMKHSEN